MRQINLSNENKRDASVGFEAKPTRQRVFFRLKDGQEKKNVQLLRNTYETDMSTLLRKYGDADAISTALIEGDPEIDIERYGKQLNGLKKVYVSEDDELVYDVRFKELVYDVEGKLKEERRFEQKESNISLDDLPIRWSGKTISKAEAVKKFVFSRHYQIHHLNGLTYDFLYDMAKELDEKRALMFVGAGKKGNEPIIMTGGGVSNRGFLEGRIQGDKYMLILHLSNLELKEFTK